MTARGLGLPDRDREVEVLLRLVEVFSSECEAEALAGRLSRIANDIVPADACAVLVLDKERSLCLLGATGPASELVGTAEVPLGQGVSGWVASHGRPLAVPDLAADPRGRDEPLRAAGLASLAALPMRVRSHGAVGVLAAGWRRPNGFRPAEVDLLASLGDLAAVAVQQTRLRRQRAARHRTREALSEQVVAAQEAERRRLAAEIHDGVSQRLVSLSFHLAAAVDALNSAPGFAAEQLRTARELAELALVETRAAITGLRPPVLDDLGLADGLESLARTAPFTRVTVQADPRQLPDHVQTMLFRIAQEAVQNATKHAEAEHLRIELRHRPDEVVMLVADNGCGFDRADAPLSPDHHGLSSMAERARLIGAECEVVSAPGRGTMVRVTLPLRDGGEPGTADGEG